MRSVNRLVLIGILALSVLLQDPPASSWAVDASASPSSDDDVQGGVSGTPDTFDIEGARRSGQGDTRAPSGAGGAGAPPPGDTDPAPDPGVDALEPSWGRQPETGAPCIHLTPRRGIDPGGALGIAWDILTLEMMVDPRLDDIADAFCDGIRGDAPPRPHGLAQAFVRRITLPAPDLRIDPGFALTGMPAFLLVHGQDDFSHAEDLAGWGVLTVDLERVAFTVDWGDGTTTTVDDGRTGAPYGGDPTEQISHVYDQRGPDTEVVVTAAWRARWRVAGFSGVVEGLATDAALALPVREYRAVRLAPDQ